MVLVLQIDEKENYCYSITPTQKENKPFNLEKKVEGTFEIISIDVKNVVSLINNGYPIEFEKINISEEGKNWLKLIGLRFWIKPFNNYYILPNNLKQRRIIMPYLNRQKNGGGNNNNQFNFSY